MALGVLIGKIICKKKKFYTHLDTLQICFFFVDSFLSENSKMKTKQKKKNENNFVQDCILASEYKWNIFFFLISKSWNKLNKEII